MGHDITAFQQRNDDSFRVAYLRRGALDPLNQIIYLALGTHDAYGGCSGNGLVVEIDHEQFKSALEILKRADVKNIKRDPNAADDIVMAFTGDKPSLMTNDTDISDEIDFAETCLEFLGAADFSSLFVHFG